MNKKGFTLVELLAVIAILAILVIIALPNVLSMFNKAKKDTFASETKDMVRIAQQQYLADFGKYTKYAIDGDSTACASDTTKACKIDKDAGNLTKFSIEFNKADGKVIKLEAHDGTYSYKYDKSVDKVDFEVKNVQAQDKTTSGSTTDGETSGTGTN